MTVIPSEATAENWIESAPTAVTWTETAASPVEEGAANFVP